MNVQLPPTGVSAFMAAHLPEFLDRFGICFTIDGPQLEYFVYERKTGQDISCSLTVSYDEAGARIDVMTFYPGLCLKEGARYLSSVCFFLVMQHFANHYHLGIDCRIELNTRKGIFDTFYALLKDFDFCIVGCRDDDRVDIQSRLLPLAMDTSMIVERALADDYAG